MIGIVVVVVVTLCAACTSGMSPTHFEFERGSRGIVPCPAMVDNGYTAGDTLAIYWFFLAKGSSEPRVKILSYYRGRTDITDPAKYNIQNISLVISNVTQSSEGTYGYEYHPLIEDEIKGSVEVSEFSFKAARSLVKECTEDQPSCVRVSQTKDITLTCTVEHAKPAVNISWLRWSSAGNKWEEVHTKRQEYIVYCNVSEMDCFYVSDTKNYTATFTAQLESSLTFFRCVTNNSELENITVLEIESQLSHEVTDSTLRYSTEPTIFTSGECSDALTSTVRIGLPIVVVFCALIVAGHFFCSNYRCNKQGEDGKVKMERIKCKEVCICEKRPNFPNEPDQQMHPPELHQVECLIGNGKRRPNLQNEPDQPMYPRELHQVHVEVTPDELVLTLNSCV